MRNLVKSQDNASQDAGSNDVSVRSRKKEHYRRIRGRSDSVQLQTRSKKQCYVPGWRIIRPEVMRVFGGNRAMAWEWFISRAIALDNRSPMELVVAGNVQLVRDHLIRLEYGTYT